MIERRPFHELLSENLGWLKAKRHFSSAAQDGLARRGWGSLRIWNDDEIAPDAGFPPHAHANMEIITYVRDGTVTRRDSLGNEGKTKAGDVQVMSAGTGIRHAEYNTEQLPARIFQIWITPTPRSARLPGGATVSQGRSLRTFCGLRQRLRKRHRRAAHSRPRPCAGGKAQSSKSASRSNTRSANDGTLTWCPRRAPSKSWRENSRA